jgi:hypothetical protein
MDPAPQIFRIRHAFLLPLGLLVLLTSGLLVLSFFQQQPPTKLAILGALWLPITLLFVESLCRHANISAESVRVHKFLRTRELRFADVISADAVQVRRRAFLSLSSEDHFVIFSNAYARFPDLVHLLLQQVPATAVSDESRHLAENPPSKSSDILSCWLAVVLVTLVLYFQVIR